MSEQQLPSREQVERHHRTTGLASRLNALCKKHGVGHLGDDMIEALDAALTERQHGLPVKDSVRATAGSGEGSGAAVPLPSIAEKQRQALQAHPAYDLGYINGIRAMQEREEELRVTRDTPRHQL